MSEDVRERMLGLRKKALEILTASRPAALLLARLSVGMVFLSTGWGKVHDIPKVTAFFESLGIPLPGFHAVFVGYTELVCGALLVLGLASRLASVPLIISMLVAIATAKKGDLHNIFDLFGFDEFTYIAVLVVVLVVGPGRLSFDRLLLAKVDPEAAAKD